MTAGGRTGACPAASGPFWSCPGSTADTAACATLILIPAVVDAAAGTGGRVQYQIGFGTGPSASVGASARGENVA